MTDRRGWRLKLAVTVPATNTIVQPDFDDLRPEGVTNHVARIALPNMAIRDDADFDRMVRVSLDGHADAVDRAMAAEPGALVVGMSSLIVWDGHEASLARLRELEARTGLPVTGGSFAIADALAALGARRIAILSPYMPVADRHIRGFFADLGYEVAGFVGLRCPSPVAIAETPPERLSAALDEIDGPEVEALVQFGTNLHFMRQAAEEEARRGKPVLAINAASYWRGLRLAGIEDRIEGYGRLLSEF